MKYKHINGQERKQMRWDNFDYSNQCIYFVTIVTNERRCLFGDVIDGEMHMNEAGKMILDEYLSIESHKTDIECLDVVVMPNHIHFLISITNPGAISLPVVLSNFKSKTVGNYCFGVKEKGWEPFNNHLWQRSYWDDIVRNQRQFDFIRRYIAINPQRWEKDAINDHHGDELDDINACLKKLR